MAISRDPDPEFVHWKSGWKLPNGRSLVWLRNERHCCRFRSMRGPYTIFIFLIWQLTHKIHSHVKCTCDARGRIFCQGQPFLTLWEDDSAKWQFRAIPTQNLCIGNRGGNCRTVALWSGCVTNVAVVAFNSIFFLPLKFYFLPLKFTRSLKLWWLFWTKFVLEATLFDLLRFRCSQKLDLARHWRRICACARLEITELS